MPPRGPTKELCQIIRDGIDQRLADVHTAMPGKIVRYDRAKNLAEVQPQLKRKFIDEADARNLPAISNVPVLHPRSGKAFIRIPIVAGDTGLIIFSERSIDLWLEKGSVIDPLDNRKFSLSDAMFIPGLGSNNDPLPTDGAATSVVIKNDAMLVELLASGKIKIKNGTADLLQLFDQTLTSLAGEPFIVNKATLLSIKTKLATLLG